MKRLMKMMLPLALVIALVFSLSITAYAATDVEEEHIAVGEKEPLLFSDVPYVSSDTSVIRIEVEGDGPRYYAVAVGVGKAEITGGEWVGKPQKDYLFTVHYTEFGVMAGRMGALFYVAAALYLLIFAEILYIFFAAPKCGMSRLWALLPIFSNVLGLIVFIFVRSKHKSGVRTKKITCPTCGGVCTDDTAFCSICGTKLR